MEIDDNLLIDTEHAFNSFKRKLPLKIQNFYIRPHNMRWSTYKNISEI